MIDVVTPPWASALASTGYAVVSDVALDADNAALRRLGAALGEASLRGINPRQPNVEQNGINRVEAMDEPRIDPAGRIILSTSAGDFPLHTDDTFTSEPVRWVLMHCWQPDASGGGASRVVQLDDILDGLDAAYVARLQVADFPSPWGPAPVIFKDQGSGAQCIRFNHRDFIGYGERFGPPLNGDQLEALDAVLQLAEARATRFNLAAGDCLIVDNHRVLHGRDAFAPGSGRLLKRLRIH